MNSWRQVLAAPRLAPLAGILVGALGGLVYWLAVQVWPTSLAVVLAMAATTFATRAHNESCLAELITAAGATSHADAHPLTPGMLAMVFLVLIQYTVLMALSAANLPVPVPPNVALGLIMIAGHAASRALRVTAIARPTHATAGLHALIHGIDGVSGIDVAIALIIGFAPAALLGLPGLVGLAAAILVRMALGAWTKHRISGTNAYLGATQALTAIGFYMGALAAWTYI